MRGVFRDRCQVRGCPRCRDGSVIAATPATTHPSPTHADADQHAQEPLRRRADRPERLHESEVGGVEIGPFGTDRISR